MGEQEGAMGNQNAGASKDPASDDLVRRFNAGINQAVEGRTTEEIRARDPELWATPDDVDDLTQMVCAAQYSRPEFLEPSERNKAVVADPAVNRLRAQWAVSQRKIQRGKLGLDPEERSQLQQQLARDSGQVTATAEGVIHVSRGIATHRTSRHSGYAEAMADQRKTLGLSEDFGSYDEGVLPSNIPYTVYGVYDGHAGPGVAKVVSERLGKAVSSGLRRIDQDLQASLSLIDSDASAAGTQMEAHLKQVLSTAFEEVDQYLDRSCSILGGGSTACCVAVVGSFVGIANTGDSTALQLHNGECVFETQSHHPDFPPERRRLQAAVKLAPDLLDPDKNPGIGALRFVREMYEFDFEGRALNIARKAHLGLACKLWDYDQDGPKTSVITQHMIGARPMIWDDLNRPGGAKLLSKIAMSRAFGENDRPYFKKFVISKPDVSVFRLEGIRASLLSCIVLATDGLFDHMERQTLVNILKKHFASREDGEDPLGWPVRAAYELVERAKMQAPGDEDHIGTDDITVWVIPCWFHLKTGVSRNLDAPIENETQVTAPREQRQTRLAGPDHDTVLLRTRIDLDDDAPLDPDKKNYCRVCGAGCVIQ